MSQDMHVRARRAAFELKAGRPDLAQAFIDQAQKALPEPTPLWLALIIESTRYQVPKSEIHRFEVLWNSELKKSVRSETAGALANLTATFVAAKVDYPGRATHIKEVVAYLGRSSRIKYGQKDLARVCTFLSLLPKELPLHEKLLKRGIKLFPNSPQFLFFAGVLELSKLSAGKGKPSVAFAHLQKARSLAEASSDPEIALILPKIREKLSFLEDMPKNMLGSPFGFNGGPFRVGPGSRTFDDFFKFMSSTTEDEDLDDEEEEPFDPDEDIFVDATARPRNPRKPASGEKASRKRKKG